MLRGERTVTWMGGQCPRLSLDEDEGGGRCWSRVSLEGAAGATTLVCWGVLEGQREDIPALTLPRTRGAQGSSGETGSHMLPCNRSAAGLDVSCPWWHVGSLWQDF